MSTSTHLHKSTYRPTPNSNTAITHTPAAAARPRPPRRTTPSASIHWLFRSNIPRRRSSFLPADINKRNFFGMGEIVGVLTNPSQTVKSLTESKRLLEEARREISETKERSNIRPKHTFSRLPGFFPRKAEAQAIERILAGDPNFTIIFGATSVGKTALLREVLSSPTKYHVLHFDLRIAGFADLSSLYMSLSQQMEQYFNEIATTMPGFQEFEKEAWAFKYDRQNVERRLAEMDMRGDELVRVGAGGGVGGGAGGSMRGFGGGGAVRTSDIARLMELFQSSLLRYWEFQPPEQDVYDRDEGEGAAHRSSHHHHHSHHRSHHSRHHHHKDDSRTGFFGSFSRSARAPTREGTDSTDTTRVNHQHTPSGESGNSGNGTFIRPGKPKGKFATFFKRTWGKLSREGEDGKEKVDKGKARQSQQSQSQQQQHQTRRSTSAAFEEHVRHHGRTTVTMEEEDEGSESGGGGEEDAENRPRKIVKKMPVIFFDEAHRLPALIQSVDAMKCLLDSMLVLTKQDRLCHVIHATSDPFYQTWLRQMNVMQHCKILTIGDCSKSETRAFFEERIRPRVPERFHPSLDFEALYEAFGGKLAHWQDFINDYINANGNLDLKQGSHFLQAHALLNLHIIHSSQSAPQAGDGGPASQDAVAASSGSARAAAGGGGGPGSTSHHPHPHEGIHPALGPASFRHYNSSPTPYHPFFHHPPNGVGVGSTGAFSNLMIGDDRSVLMSAGHYAADFTAMQLLKVMSRLARPDAVYLPYFLLCRELGVRAVDGMVRGRVLELRWTEVVTKEGVEDGPLPPPPPPLHTPMGMHPHPPSQSGGSVLGVGGRGSSAGMMHAMGGSGTHFGPGSSGTAVELTRQASEEDDMVAISERDIGNGSAFGGTAVMGPPPPFGPPPPHPLSGSGIHRGPRGQEVYEDEILEVVGPKLVPVTPIMRYAMREVVQEYEDDQSVSEYASLSSVDEY